MRVLFLENEDSFSWNIVDRLPFGRDQVCVRSGREAAEDPGALDGFEAVVIGSGPTDPIRAGIVDVVHAAARSRLPLLGICLGHQALGQAFGARLRRVRPIHGKQTSITFIESRRFPSFTGPEIVMCYHSLALTGVALPLRVVAESAEGIPMAIEHESLPMAGLQFHPDSYATPRGSAMISDFFATLR